MADEVFAERDGSIATVVLNRPDKLNAMDKTSWILLDGIMAELDAQDDVRCIV